MEKENPTWLQSRVIVAALGSLFLLLPLIGISLSLGIQGGIATLIQFFSGWPFYKATWKGLKSKTVNRYLLITLATTAAYLFGLYASFATPLRGIYFEISSLFITFLLIGQLIELPSYQEEETPPLFTLGILFLALATFIFWTFVKNSPTTGFFNGVAVLMVASPFFTISKEKERKIKRLYIDKSIISDGGLAIEKTEIDTHYFPIIKTLCEHAEYPTAKVLLQYLNERKIHSVPMLLFRSSEEGITGYFDNRKYILGPPSFLKEENAPFLEADEEEIVIALGTEKLFIGHFILSEELKAGAKETITQFKRKGIQTILLTKDRKKIAEKMVKELNLDSYQAEVLKMGKNSLLLTNGEDLGEVLKRIDTSQYNHRKNIEHSLFSLSYNFIAIPLAALGYLNPIFAGALMVLSSTLLAYQRSKIKSAQLFS